MAYVDDSRDISIADGARVEDYFALLKPRVMSLVVFTAVVGLLLAPGGINPIIGAIAILCIAVGAGASGSLNMWYDAEIDAVMSRTANRPIPAGRVPRDHALTLGLVLSAFSVMLLGLATNWLAAGLLAFTIFFYAVIYTMWLKRATPQNIVIGGAAGAFPPMIGWALALYKQGDYGAAGIPMLPNVAGEAATKSQILIYSVVLVIVAFVPVYTGFGGIIYASIATITGLSFVGLAWRLFRTRDDQSMRRAGRALFLYSLSYLAVVFLALLTDHYAAMVGWI